MIERIRGLICFGPFSEFLLAIAFILTCWLVTLGFLSG